MKHIRIGTRDSQLAVWQATWVQQLLSENGVASELVYIKSEGDTDLVTPLYALGVQGIFTRTLDAALLSNKIDIAVHSMKDVPTQLAEGILQAAVLKRGNYKDIFVYKNEEDLQKIGWDNSQWSMVNGAHPFTIATSSVRRMAQWMHRYPGSCIENLRGNVNTRLRKLTESHWNGAIFAAAGLERIGLRPGNAVDLDWMLPAPSQGAVMVVCRAGDDYCFDSCQSLNDDTTALCTQIEKDFLKTLMGGCTTPISALAEKNGHEIRFRGNILSTDGKQKVEVEKTVAVAEIRDLGVMAAKELLANGGQAIADSIQKKRLTTDGEA